MGYAAGRPVTQNLRIPDGKKARNSCWDTRGCFHIGQHPDHYLPNRQLVAHYFGFALVAVAHSELDYFVKYWYFSLVFVVTLLMNVVSI
jgi:hypothetical protein